MKKAIGFMIVAAMLSASLVGCGGGTDDPAAGLSETHKAFWGRWDVIAPDVECVKYPEGNCGGFTEEEGVLLKNIILGKMTPDSISVSGGLWEDDDKFPDGEENFYHSWYDIEEISHEVIDLESRYYIEDDALVLYTSGKKFDPACWDSQILFVCYNHDDGSQTGKCSYPPLEPLLENCTATPFEDKRAFPIVSVSDEEILLQDEAGNNIRLLKKNNIKGLEYKQFWR